MFNPTKAHEKYVRNNQPKIRIGNRVPEDAVNLAYTHAPALKAEENVQVTDLSGYILENINEDRIYDVIMEPNHKHELKISHSKNINIKSQTLLVTNVFEEEEPLYFVYDLEYPIANKVKSDAHGFFETKSITLITHLGEALPENMKYKMQVIPTDQEKLIHVRIYTNFQSQPGTSVKVIYTAIKDNKSIPNKAELLNPQPLFDKSTNLKEVVTVPRGHSMYYQAQTEKLGEHKLYVSEVPIRELDYRTPFPYRYKITAQVIIDGVTSYIRTPWLYDSIISEQAITYMDKEYEGKHKKVGGKIAKDILSDYGNVSIFDHPNAMVKVTVESSKPEVLVDTKEDGMGYVLATTEEIVDHLILPYHSIVEKHDQEIEFQLITKIDDAPPEMSKHVIRPSDGLVKVFATFSGETISAGLRIEDTPVNLVIKPDGLYAFTEAWDIFYVPKYSIRLSDNQQIEVHQPIPSSAQAVSENWYLRVKNGKFEQESTTSTGLPVKHQFSIPEYYKQNFDTQYGMPYRKILKEEPIVIGKHKLQLRHTPLFIRLDKDIGQYNIEVFVNGIPTKLKNWHSQDGIIEVDVTLKSTDDVHVNYYYQEQMVTYRGYWDEANQKFWHLDLNPSHGHFYTDIDQNTNEITDVPSFQLINKTIYLYIKPNAKFSENNEMVRGSYENHVLFHTFEPLWSTNALLLARIQVRPNSSVENIRIIDTRVRGGGLKEAIHKDIMKQVEPESVYYWDIGYWDGEPYSENGVFIARLPKYILEEHGGTFTNEEVETIVKKHIGFGNLVVIEYIEEPKHLLPSPLTLSGYIDQ